MLKALHRSYNNPPDGSAEFIVCPFLELLMQNSRNYLPPELRVIKDPILPSFSSPIWNTKKSEKKKKKKKTKKKPTKITTKNNKERKIKEQKRERTLNFSSGKEEARNSTQPMRNSIEKQPHKVLNKYNKLHLK